MKKPNEIKLSIAQLEKCKHTLGLTRNIKVSNRNYYNSGEDEDEDLEQLVTIGLMKTIDRGLEMGGWFYHVTDEGMKVMKRIFGSFKESR